MSKNDLTLSELASFVTEMSSDFCNYAENNAELPAKLVYKVVKPERSERVARAAFWDSIEPKPVARDGFNKLAFDTRRVDQEHERNPRSNLQYWHRSQPFIDQEAQNKINIFSKLFVVLNDLKQSYGHSQEWHDSYSRMLYDNINRTLRIKQADSDIFGPQLCYLEQLLSARYRLNLEDISKMSSEELKAAILNKDESLLKRGFFLEQASKNLLNKDGQNNIANSEVVAAAPAPQVKVINTQESIINAIFGASNLSRKDGERKAERTITITIRDEVID